MIKKNILSIFIIILWILLSIQLVIAGLYATNKDSCSADSSKYIIYDMMGGSSWNTTYWVTAGNAFCGNGLCNITSPGGIDSNRNDYFKNTSINFPASNS